MLDSRLTLRMRSVVKTYGSGDAAVLALVERLNEPKLATLDHRHFSTMRPRHVEALVLVPGVGGR